MISQNGAIFSMLSILKTFGFSLVAEALMGLIYHRPAGRNSKWCSSKSASELDFIRKTKKIFKSDNRNKYSKVST